MKNTTQKEGLELEIENFELIVGATLPNKYKDFLKKYNGIELSYNSLPLSQNTQDINIFKLKSTQEIVKAWHYIKDYEELRGLIAIGDTLGDGIFLAMSIEEGDFYGCIYVVYSDLSMDLQAPSFEEFLDPINYEE